MRRSTRVSSSKRSSARRSCAVDDSSNAASPSSLSVPAPPLAVKVSMCALVPRNAIATVPSVTLTPSTKLRTVMPAPSTWPVYCGAPKRPPKLALACRRPPRRQPGASHGPQVPRLSTRSSPTPSIGVSAAGHVALGRRSRGHGGRDDAERRAGGRGREMPDAVVGSDAEAKVREAEVLGRDLVGDRQVAAGPLDHHVDADAGRAARLQVRADAQVAAPAEAGLQRLQDRRDGDGVDVSPGHRAAAARLRRLAASRPGASAGWRPAPVRCRARATTRSGAPAQTTRPRTSRASSQVVVGVATERATASRIVPCQPPARLPSTSTRPPSATRVSMLREPGGGVAAVASVAERADAGNAADAEGEAGGADAVDDATEPPARSAAAPAARRSMPAAAAPRRRATRRDASAPSRRRRPGCDRSRARRRRRRRRRNGRRARDRRRCRHASDRSPAGPPRSGSARPCRRSSPSLLTCGQRPAT